MAEVAYGLPDSPPKASLADDIEVADLARKAVAWRYSSSLEVASKTGVDSRSSLADVLPLDSQHVSPPTSSVIAGDSTSLPLFQLDQEVTPSTQTKSTDAPLPELLADQHILFLAAGQIDFLSPLISRIRTLARLAAEEEDQEAIRSGSLTGFLRFLYVHRSRIWLRPQLVLTPEGHLRAEWRKTRDYRIAVRFLDKDRVTFVSFTPDPRDPTVINRVGGSSTVRGFFETIPNTNNATARLFGEAPKSPAP